MTDTQTTLLLGIGNVLLGDEGVGAAVVHQFSRQHPRDDVQCLDGGTLSFTLAQPIGECQRLIVVDAAALGEAPGSVRVFEGEAMDHQLRAHARSVHEVSLGDLFDMARLTDTLPAYRALIGIEPDSIGWSDHLSPAVDAAQAQALEHITRLLARWDAGQASD